MRKFLTNKKALSPVVATIILVAVTIVVAFAVAYWMVVIVGEYQISGGRICGIIFGGTPNDSDNVIGIVVESRASVDILEVKVNNITKPFNSKSLPERDATYLIMINNVGWVSKDRYRVEIIASAGTIFGTEEAIAP